MTRVCEVGYRPTACRRTYRLIIVRQAIKVEEGQRRLFDEIRYWFYLTNDRESAPRVLVFKANGRCDQENLITAEGRRTGASGGDGQPGEQLGAHGDEGAGVEPESVVRAVGPGAPAAQGSPSLQMEFKPFVNTIIMMPCHVVRGWAPVVVPVAVVERVARGIPAGVACPAALKAKEPEGGI